MKQKKESSFVIYKKLLKYVVPYWPAFAVAIVANICYSSIDAWFVHFLQPLLNKGFINKDASFIAYLPFLVVSVFIGRGVASVSSNYFMTYVARSVVMVLRQKLFSHYQRMPAKAFDKSTTGNLLSSIIFNVQQVANASADALTTFLQAFILVIGLLVVMFNVNWELSLIFFITLPLISIVVGVSSRHIRRYSTDIQTSMGEITTIAEENIDGYKVVRTFGGEEYEQDRFDKANSHNRAREMKMAVVKGFSISGVQILAAIALATIIYLATSSHHQFNLTAGSFTALIAAMMALLKPMKDLTNVNTKIQRGLAGAHAVFEVLESEEERNDGEVKADNVSGKIDINSLNFRYAEETDLVLKDLKLSINPGEIVALVGRSGSGKSSLVNLLMRFYTCADGGIHLDGKDIHSYELKSYRQQFAFVTQQVVLFNDTITNNIAYGVAEENIDQAAVLHAAKVAHTLEFIDCLPGGFDTVIGEDGALLSGGQRQRLALARAVYKKAPILVLDEATSALDTESEKYIQDALDKMMHQCTTIVIAHRLSTIKQADKIVVMDHGCIVEQGRHEELLASKGYYAKLYDMQFRDE
jgi:subfamily B ATP-binding cassette protein MsbA